MTSIIQWNAQGISNKKEELIELINTFNCSIVAIQETLLGSNSNFKIPKFSKLLKEGNFNRRYHGGVGLFIREDIPYEEINLRTSLTAVAARVTIKSTFTVCNIYLPPSQNVYLNDLNALYQQLPQPTLILGDFNAHSPLWGHISTTTDTRGTMIENFINSNQLNLFNNHDPTRIEGLSETSIDLSMCSPRIQPEFDWSILNSTHGSDHCPIIIQCDSSNHTPHTTPIQGWNIKLAMWNIYRSSPSWSNPPDIIESDNISILTDLCSRFESAASKSIPPRITRKRPSNPWWNAELELSKRLREEAYQRSRRHKTQQNILQWKRLRAQHKNRVRFYKRKSWIEYISKINRNTPIKTIYDTMRKIRGRPPKKISFLKDGNNTYTSTEQISNKLAQSFSNVSSTNNYSNAFRQHKINMEQIQLNLSDDQDEQYNRPFTMKELNHALSDTSDTSPGPDGIHYQMIKNLPQNAKEYLLSIYNKFFDEGYFPDQWKQAIVIAIVKPGKDILYCTSYRPIALTSCLCKLFEKMITFRLSEFMDINNIISIYQCGCRKNRSTIDHLTRLEKEVHYAFANKQHIISIFFDIEKAYDMTWRHGIIRDLHSYGMRGKLLIYIREFLKERFFRVKVDNVLSDEQVQENGVPQGSVLSVLLFAVKINSLAKELPTNDPGFLISLFVDDLQISFRHSDPNVIKVKLQNSLDKIHNWSEKNGFKFSSTKTQLLHFKKQEIQ